MIDPYVSYLIDLVKEKDDTIQTLREALAECQLAKEVMNDVLLCNKPQEAFHEYQQRAYRE